MATDPEPGQAWSIMIKDYKSGEYITLTGNMSGCLIGDYEIGQRKATEGLPEDGVFVKTIVSSNMADEIARYYGVKLIEVLTGFKYIGSADTWI